VSILGFFKTVLHISVFINYSTEDHDFPGEIRLSNLLKLRYMATLKYRRARDNPHIRGGVGGEDVRSVETRGFRQKKPVVPE